jgi:hypothetical protein
MTTLTKHQTLTREARWTENGVNLRLVATVRHDDRCNNGANTFSVTGTLYEGGREVAGGCLHDYIAERMPELAPYLQWHLTSTDGPLHYIANTRYWAREGNLEYARKSAVWPDATLAQLCDADLLRDRLPNLMADFRGAVESLGLSY